ncbi:MAG TPA: polyprenyl diphosphate synthase [Anaerolineae bacterium]|nr:polyprenyl diphosphate synthase [Anaerolineae bacterium]HOR01313.1 polyprenyl diphosphate synthase [Anaerolineae bacterium]HPL30333.1 polyprenyl diphosphate synthase [Anaerolineae bacterium]
MNEQQLDLRSLKIPRHVGIIMDGNGRWAQRRGLPRAAGHREGMENLRRVLRACVEFGIPILTVYAFSTENWGRPAQEVRALLTLLERSLRTETAELHKNGVSVRHIGRTDTLAPGLQQGIADAVALTRDNRRLILNVAFSYGGRDEIVHAVQRIMADGISAEQVDEALISRYLYTAGQPDLDLVIRTAGEMRLSNFLIWQAAYAEYYSTPVLWPDFGREELLKALVAYTQRDRRFGLIKEP